MSNGIPIHLLPPVLSLVSGLYLALLALARGGDKREKIYFALLCLWCSLLSPVFICHQLITDQTVILKLERSVHFFYVYVPVFQLLFFHQVLGVRRKYVIALTLFLSFCFSLTTQSPYYFKGLNHFDWGYIAQGGIAFQLFGLYGAICFGYCMYCFIVRLRVETDPRLRLKLKYMLVSFGLTGLMTLMNLPAIHGYDLYPAGNFSFLPLAILAYGILKHRLLQIRSLLNITLTRVLLLLLILVPNYYIFTWGRRHVSGLNPVALFFILAVWSWLNFYYIRWVYVLLRNWFYKSRLYLQRAEARMVKALLELRSVRELGIKIDQLLVEVLPYSWAALHVYGEGRRQLTGPDNETNPVSEALTRQLAAFNGIIEKRWLHLLTTFAETRDEAVQLMSAINADHVVPLAHDDMFVGLLALPEKEDMQPVTPFEAAFIKRISRTLALATANAAIFQSISTLKDRLQQKTESLEQEVEERSRAEQELKQVQAELRETNLELESAILQANEMRAKAEIGNHVLTQEMEDRKRIEAALRQSEETYRLIADNSTDVIWTIDLNDHFTYLSPSIYQLLGYRPEEMLGMHTSTILTSSSYQKARQTTADDLKRVSATKRKRRRDRFLELEQVHKDGTTVWTEVNTRFIDNADGRIVGILGVTRDISERRKSEQNLLYMAHHDALTGLYNRKAFMELLETEIKYAQRYDTGLALLFFDLNKFKKVNDTFGHEVGDAMLKTVAERLRASVRESDLIARLGGDEFTIILRNPDQVRPETVAERVAEIFSTPIDFYGGRVDFVTASTGIATYPGDGLTASTLLKSADLAMYKAKRSGLTWLHFEKPMASAG